MRAARTTRPLAVLAALLALVVAVTTPAAQADSKIILDSGHTDAFYILSESGTPEVLVANRYDYYTPDETMFRIRGTAYSAGHEVNGPFTSPAEGYFTGSPDVTPWFEPGWNAPGFRNQFTSLRVDFTRVTGPGRVLIVGNAPGEEGTGPRQSYLADGSYDVVAGASLPVKGHTHAHWFFTHAGEYQITGRAVGTRPDGTEVASEPFTVTFRIDRNDQDTRGEDPAPPTTAPIPEPTPAPSTEPAPQPSQDPGTQPTAAPTTAPTAAPSAGPGSSVFDTHEPYRLTHGHVDLFSVIAKDGRLVMAAKDESTGKIVVRQPEDVTVVVGESTRREFSGSVASTLVPSGYFLPESGLNQQEAPFPGWDTYSVEPEFYDVDIEFVDVTGPGRVFLFSTAHSGMRSQLVSGGYELKDGEVIRMEDPGHVHTNWVFETPGTYTMTVRAKGESWETDETVTSQPATYTWVVGDATPPEPTPSASPNTTASASPSPTAGASTSAPATATPDSGPSTTPSSVPSSTADPAPSASAGPSSSTAPGTAEPGGTTPPGASAPSSPAPTTAPVATGTPTATATSSTTGTPGPGTTPTGGSPALSGAGALGGSGGGAAAGGGAGSGAGAGSGGLARTGAGAATLVGASLIAFVGGGAFLAARRRQA